ncbi:probable G-protein coupled receptor 160 [Thalassophryne amazonica]|uniref:probable G-protein coupled receptor 160 n=1 Tax=Thalassophryne amazonica TaxID=390379 RepID=UPI001470FF5A|nr:probable G-protein coupled receptor 160 [Thalassophryne amazonica]XP_034039394.1 probable G-protein coupled receptor 160 [Thalassophryne amazonica]
MTISIFSILLSLGGKCLLNWTLVLFQRSHICRSFLGVFSVSLALVDMALTLILTSLHIHGERVFLSGLQLTRFHVCLFVQIIGEVYKALHWPIVVAATLEHFLTLSRRFRPTTTTAAARLFVTIILWFLDVLYVFISDFSPVLEDVSFHQLHRCTVFHTSQLLQVAIVMLLITLICSAIHGGCLPVLSCCRRSQLSTPPPKGQFTNQSQTPSRFLNAWTILLLFLAVLLLLTVGIPAHLSLSVVWLCILNSFLSVVTLHIFCPASRPLQGSTAAVDGTFNSGAVDGL